MKNAFGQISTFSILAFVAQIIPLQAQTIISSDGHEYDITCNVSGYRLISKYPIARAVGLGASTQYLKEREILFLGKSCDALSEIWRTGKWCWANGGVSVEFKNIKLGFPRGEINCPNDQDETLPCSCQ